MDVRQHGRGSVADATPAADPGVSVRAADRDREGVAGANRAGIYTVTLHGEVCIEIVPAISRTPWPPSLGDEVDEPATAEDARRNHVLLSRYVILPDETRAGTEETLPSGESPTDLFYVSGADFAALSDEARRLDAEATGIHDTVPLSCLAPGPLASFLSIRFLGAPCLSARHRRLLGGPAPRRDWVVHGEVVVACEDRDGQRHIRVTRARSRAGLRAAEAALEQLARRRGQLLKMEGSIDCVLVYISGEPDQLIMELGELRFETKDYSRLTRADGELTLLRQVASAGGALDWGTVEVGAVEDDLPFGDRFVDVLDGLIASGALRADRNRQRPMLLLTAAGRTRLQQGG